MRVGLDIDGVLYSFVGALRMYLMEFEGFDPFELPNPTEWDWFYHQWGLSYERFEQIYTHNAQWLFTYGGIKEDKLKVLNNLKKDGHQIFLITNRGKALNGELYTKLWLSKNKIPYDQLIITDKKECFSQYLDIYVDDYWENLAKMRETNPLLETILYERPYNEHHRNSTEWRSIPHLGELEDFVDLFQFS